MECGERRGNADEIRGGKAFMGLNERITEKLQNFAAEITATFALPITCNPEDQLKGPTATLLKEIGKAMGLTVEAATEVHAEKLGRPDLGIAVKGLLCGHIELKAPGKGAEPEKFKSGDRDQWERFQNLPNLIYTDGNDWALYRSGGRQGQRVRLAGDVTKEGKKAIAGPESEKIFYGDTIFV
jgi:hypothetical protein